MHCAHVNDRGQLCALHALPGSEFCPRHQAGNVSGKPTERTLETSLGLGLELVLPPMI